VSADASRISWDTCDCCGGSLPLYDGDNGAAELPESPTGGECPGAVTPGGNCGAYDDAALADWLAEMEDTL
jgi:hypothetical protein